MHGSVVVDVLVNAALEELYAEVHAHILDAVFVEI